MKTKITVIAILAMALVMMIGCNLVSEVESIQLINPPHAVYQLNAKDDIDANNFKVKITLTNGTELDNIPLTDSRLTVEGLVNGKLDVATPGVKTIKITYMGVSITATYVVVDENGVVSAEKWEAKNEDTNDGAELLWALSNPVNGVVTLSGEYNLAGKQWPAMALTSSLEINGTATIKNLVMTHEGVFGPSGYNTGNKTYYDNNNAGLFATVAKNVTLKISNVVFEGVVIEQTSQYQGEYCKNFGTVVGYSEGIVILNNVDVTNATIKGNGRIGGLVGYAIGGSVEINNCDIVATLIGHNPVAVTSEEGEADKIGGLVGMVNNNIDAIFNTNTVKVIVNGTRDCGGLVGFVYNTSDLTFTDNQVLSGSIITLSVEGGMNGDKGKRHAGGIIGTWCFSTRSADATDGSYKKGDMTPNGTYTFTGNTVAADVVIAINAKYEHISSKGDIIGGYRYFNETNNTFVKPSFELAALN